MTYEEYEKQMLSKLSKSEVESILKRLNDRLDRLKKLYTPESNTGSGFKETYNHIVYNINLYNKRLKELELEEINIENTK